MARESCLREKGSDGQTRPPRLCCLSEVVRSGAEDCSEKVDRKERKAKGGIICMLGNRWELWEGLAGSPAAHQWITKSVGGGSAKQSL